MKKIITLVLAIVLLMTSIVAIAESTEVKSKATPNFKSFAKMEVKFYEGDYKNVKRYEIKLSKPVDKLWVLWAEKGAEPEELGVDENLEATALAADHKYMPGITQTIGTRKVTDTYTQNWYYDADASEDYFKCWSTGSTLDYANREGGTIFFIESKTKAPKWNIYAKDEIVKGKKVTTYVATEDYYDVDEKEWKERIVDAADNLEFLKKEYLAKYDDFSEIEVVKPEKWTEEKEGLNKWGEKVINKVDVKNTATDTRTYYYPGEIVGVKKSVEVNKTSPTNKATAFDAAFATLEGDWLVYRNRKGTIVGIELYEGQL